MKTEITTKQAIGKTVAGFLCSGTPPGQMVVYFDDETFTTFSVDVDRDGSATITKYAKLEYLFFGYEDDLVNVGIITKQELKALHDEEDKKIEQQERLLYKQLKAKFG